MNYVDDYRLPERPLEPYATRCIECADCGAEIFDGEMSVLWDGDRLCMDCACERVKESLDVDGFRQLADRLSEVFNFATERVYEGVFTWT